MSKVPENKFVSKEAVIGNFLETDLQVDAIDDDPEHIQVAMRLIKALDEAGYIILKK